MCRAVAVIAVVPDDLAARRLQIAVGSEAQIVGVAVDLDDLTNVTASRTFDVVVIDGRSPAAGEAVRSVRESHPAAGIVWIGENIPPGTHATVSPERLLQDLAKGVSRALTSRK